MSLNEIKKVCWPRSQIHKLMEKIFSNYNEKPFFTDFKCIEENNG